MGRLRRLELENFKSYSGKQVIGPFDDFSCIIGPNGAGKSNMMDAISFVLGVQSRHLRSAHLKELIYRKDAKTASAKKASVSLIYSAGDNEVPGYAADDEIRFTRSVSANGVSSYRLDNKEISYEKYEEILNKIGVLVKARNFLVFQGDIESVAAKSPAELTKLIEQISGSDSLKAEYDELLVRKNATEECTLFMMQKKKMFAAQRKEVKEQKDEAERFQEKLNELNDLKTERVLFELWQVRNELDQQDELSAGVRREKEEVLDEERTLDGEMDSAKKALAKANKNLVAGEKDMGGKKKAWLAVGPKIEEWQQKLKSTKKKLADLQRTESNMETDRSAQVHNIAALKKDIADLEIDETALLLESDKASRGDVRLSEEKVAEYSRLREELSSRSAIETAELDTITKELQSKQRQIISFETQVTLVSQELSLLGNQKADYAERLNKLNHAVDNGKNEINALQVRRKETIAKITASEEQIKKLETKLAEVESRLLEAGDDRRRSRQEIKMNEAIDAMKRVFPQGVHGRLLDLCRPMQKKYSQAIAVTAGRHMDAVVVETKTIAAECIRYLKDQRVGTCMFLPLDNLSVKPVEERLRGFSSNYRLCVDLVDCEDRFKPAVAYALGSTLVCDSLEEAQSLCFGSDEKVKVVTVKGHVISKSGAMTGGRMQSDGHDRWEDKEVNKLKEEKTELEMELANCRRVAVTRQAVVDIETEIKTIQTRLQFGEADKKVANERIGQLEQQQSLKTTSLDHLNRDLAKLRKETEKLERESGRLTQDLREIEKNVFGAFSRSVGVENIREYEENQLVLHQTLIKRRTELTQRKASLTSQLEYEHKRDFSGPLLKVRGNIQAVKEELSEAETQIKSLQKEEDQLLRSLEKAKARLHELTAEKNETSNAVRTLQTRISETTRKREQLEKQLSGVEIQTERARSRMHEVLQRAQMEEISLPGIHGPSSGNKNDDELRWSGSLSQASSRFSRKGRQGSNPSSSSDEDSSESANGHPSGSSEGEGATSASGSKSSRTATSSAHFSQPDNPTTERDQRKVARVDLSSMEQYSKLSKGQLAAKDKELASQISQISSELDEMQPNMHAVERYEGVMEKLRESSDELEAIKETARVDNAAFDAVKKKRQKLFSDCFAHVSKALGVIYQDLTRSSRHPLGGNAYLTLEATDEPYLGGIRFTAMPPMKRFRDMEQLSGGEKTIAALALLFSIHSYRQAPFFVLDEVDAALDNVNVKKICNYIRQRSRDFQCIVISLKDNFFEHADCLVGICKDVETLSSKVLTLDLKKYPSSDDGKDVGVSSSVTPTRGLNAVSMPSPTTSSSSRGGDRSNESASTSSRAGGDSSSSPLGKRKSGGHIDASSGSWVRAKYGSGRASGRVSSLVQESILEEAEDDPEEGEQNKSPQQDSSSERGD